MSTLYITCGPSGCGKSTWSRQYIAFQDALGNDIRYVSRDEIRFNLLKDGENYFAHEKEVFRKFVATIALTLADDLDVVADATHVNEASRKKLLRAIDETYTDYNIIYVVMNTTFSTCFSRNDLRSGHQRVPEDILAKMYQDFTIPTWSEDIRAVARWMIEEF